MCGPMSSDICTVPISPRRSSPYAFSSMTGGLPSPACGVYRWLSVSCSAAGKSQPAPLSGRRRPALRLTDGIQEALENVRRSGRPTRKTSIWNGCTGRSTNTNGSWTRGELGTGVFVNAASVIMRLGRGNYHPHRSRPDPHRPDRFHAVVFIPACHHPDLCPL